MKYTVQRSLLLLLGLVLLLSACGGSGPAAQSQGQWDSSTWDAATWQ